MKTVNILLMMLLMAVMVFCSACSERVNTQTGKVKSQKEHPTEDTTHKSRVSTTKVSLRILNTAIIQYKMDTGRYPDEDMGLQALVEEPIGVNGWNPGGYLKSTELPIDAWGNDYDYKLRPENGKAFVIISWGADGEPEGEGYDTDLHSTDR